MNLRRMTHRTKKNGDRAKEIESHLVHEQDANGARGLFLRKRAAALNSVLGTLA
jgi:hypothetical protein